MTFLRSLWGDAVFLAFIAVTEAGILLLLAGGYLDALAQP
jgi:hypothetical protein